MTQMSQFPRWFDVYERRPPSGDQVADCSIPDRGSELPRPNQPRACVGWRQERVSEEPDQSHQSSAYEYFGPLRLRRSGAAYEILKGGPRVDLLLTLLELVPYIEGALETAGRDPSPDTAGSAWRDPAGFRVELCYRSGRILEDGRENRSGVLAFERTLAGRHLVEDDAE